MVHSPHSQPKVTGRNATRAILVAGISVLLGCGSSDEQTPSTSPGASGSAGAAAGGTTGGSGAGTVAGRPATAGAASGGITSQGGAGLQAGTAGTTQAGGGLQGTAGAQGGTGAGTAGAPSAGSAGKGAPVGGAAGSGGAAGGSGGASPMGGSAGTGPGGAAAAGAAAGGAAGAAGAAGASAGSAGMGGDGGGLSSGCGKAITRPDPRTQQTMMVAGATRYYLLDVPEGADNKTPLTLIFALHGFDMNNVAIVGLYNFTSRSGGKVITVFPQGEGPAPGNTSHWGDGVLNSTWMSNQANYDFISGLKADLEERFCIDTSREFITGFSMGGYFTNGLACRYPDWFRGYAPVGAGGPGSCTNAESKPAMIIHHGTADRIVEPVNGEGTRDFWAERNGCNQTTMPTLMGCQSYGACSSPVLWCVGNWEHTISSTAAGNIWSFFNGLD